MKKLLLTLSVFVCAMTAQQRPDIIGQIVGTQKATIAIADMRGAGRAADHTAVVNSTIFRDIEDAAVFKMAPKSMYPLKVPQRPQDFRKPLQYDPANRNADPW